MNVNIEIGTEANFDHIISDGDKPVLVDFWAPWCGPCQMVGPILDEVADEYAGRAKVVKVNVDEHNQIAAKMGVQSIPTIVLFKDGEVKELVVGAQPKAGFTAMIDRALDN